VFPDRLGHQTSPNERLDTGESPFTFDCRAHHPCPTSPYQTSSGMSLEGSPQKI
jgi:hypothetical protein